MINDRISIIVVMNGLAITAGSSLHFLAINGRIAPINFAKINVTQLTIALAKEHCEVLSMQEKDESLESYYISLVGGGNHD